MASSAPRAFRSARARLLAAALPFLFAACASAPDVPNLPGEEIARYTTADGTFVLRNVNVVVPGTGASKWDGYNDRAIYTVDGRVVVSLRRSHLLDLAVIDASHVFLLDKERNYYDTSRPPTWRRLTVDGFDAEPLPWNWVEEVPTPAGPRYLARGEKALALCGPDLDPAHAERRFEHVYQLTRLGERAVWVKCKFEDERGETQVAETITNSLLEPLSLPGTVRRAGLVYAWRDDGRWRVMDDHGWLQPWAEEHPCRDLAPVHDADGDLSAVVATVETPDGPALWLISPWGKTVRSGLRAAELHTIVNNVYDKERKLLWWRKKGKTEDTDGETLRWLKAYPVWLTEGPEGFEVVWPADGGALRPWASVATDRDPIAALAKADAEITARLRHQRDGADRRAAELAELEHLQRSWAERDRLEALAEERSRQQREAALAASRAAYAAEAARRQAEAAKAYQKLDVWSQQWQSTGATPFYSNSGGSNYDSSMRDAMHRATMNRYQSETRAYERQTEAMRRNW